MGQAFTVQRGTTFAVGYTLSLYQSGLLRSMLMMSYGRFASSRARVTICAYTDSCIVSEIVAAQNVLEKHTSEEYKVILFSGIVEKAKRYQEVERCDTPFTPPSILYVSLPFVL